MNDGQRHDPLKQAVLSAFHTIDATQIAEQSRQWAQFLANEIKPEVHPSRLSDFAFQLPVYVVASLLGVPQDRLQQTAQWMSNFAWCLAPVSSPEQIEQGKRAASHLLDLLYTALSTQEAEHTHGLLGVLMREARRVGIEAEEVVANGIGLLWQAYEATAGLIGNTLLTLAAHQDVRKQVIAHPDMLDLVIQEVLRYDPPIQNTRRFLAGNGIVAGEKMKEGDIILIVLAAANRDPAENQDPERFDIFRKDPRIYTFGVGAHACPGEIFATTIARAGVEQLMVSGVNMQQLVETVRYRASANTRIPLF